jgi:hypothetical protein
MSMIFESPDQGQTVYVRESGSPIRILYQESEKVKSLREDLAETELWKNIRDAAKTNHTLKDALEHAKLLYHLSNDNGKK